MTDPAKAISDFIYTRTYARWLPDENRREFWPETVNRYVSWLLEEQPLTKAYTEELRAPLFSAILNHQVVPSMRAMWSAGKAANKDNTCIYNCSYLPLDSIDAFKELFYILMCGTGVGFSCESKYVDKLPTIHPLTAEHPHVFRFEVPDTREGWANTVEFVLKHEFLGWPYFIDYSKIRPAGERLITFGGYASGPEPLITMVNEIHKIFVDKRVQPVSKLTTLEVHDIACLIAEAVVVGGVRRSSLISLSDVEDTDLRNAKNWPFPQHRGMSNNSAVFNGDETEQEFNFEWQHLAESGTGERGIFNRNAAQLSARYFPNNAPGINPCAEIILRENEFCNLSEAILRSNDTVESLARKVELATIIGILQSTKTYFPFLRKIWAANCNEERLLGVSITGQFDNPGLLSDTNLWYLRGRANILSHKLAKQLGINHPTAVTCTKPSGTVSQLVNASSGAHPRYAKHYIRRYRISNNDPLLSFMERQGFQSVADTVSADTSVIEFPMASPKGAITRHEVSADFQLDHYLKMQHHWADHNTSMTIYVKPNEWESLGKKVFKNKDFIVGVAFLPVEDQDHHYELAPYQEITKEQFNLALDKLPQIDYTKLSEKEDATIGEREYACVGDKCEI